ncbi:hypothetical protein [Aeromonas caviae]|uniref:hypothetical protein n=1 Tax=Aeromonas caviae TaxID=648 RepID=UPI0038595D8D
MTMLLLTYKPEVATAATVTKRVNKGRREYNADARQRRMKATLKTILSMNAKEDGVEFTVTTITKRLQMPFRNQILKGEVNDKTIKADVNVILKQIGGVTEVRRETPEGSRGRPQVVYTFNANELSTKGRLLHAEIKREEAKGSKK